MYDINICVISSQAGASDSWLFLGFWRQHFRAEPGHLGPPAHPPNGMDALDRAFLPHHPSPGGLPLLRVPATPYRRGGQLFLFHAARRRWLAGTDLQPRPASPTYMTFNYSAAVETKMIFKPTCILRGVIKSLLYMFWVDPPFCWDAKKGENLTPIELSSIGVNVLGSGGWSLKQKWYSNQSVYCAGLLNHFYICSKFTPLVLRCKKGQKSYSNRT